MIVEKKDRNSPLSIKMTITIKTLNKSTLIDTHTWDFYAESCSLAWKLKFCIHSKCTGLFCNPDCY